MFPLRKSVLSGQIYEKSARVEGLDKCRKQKRKLARMLPLLLRLARQKRGLAVRAVSGDGTLNEVKELWSLVVQAIENVNFKTHGHARVSSRPVRFEVFCAANHTRGVDFRFPRGVDLFAGLALRDQAETAEWDKQALHRRFELPNSLIASDSLARGFGFRLWQLLALWRKRRPGAGPGFAEAGPLESKGCCFPCQRLVHSRGASPFAFAVFRAAAAALEVPARSAAGAQQVA